MLITGVSGLLGNNLAYYFKDAFVVEGWYCSHPVVIDGVKTQKVDIVAEAALPDLISECAPDVVVHCASLTDVDYCEKHKEITRQVNCEGTRYLVQACCDSKIKFVYISTDSVYAGSKGKYSETDAVHPLNYYGVSKLAGEQIVLRKEDSIVLRTNIFGWNIQEKHSLAEWILHELSQSRAIKGFKNIYFSSIYTFEFARILGQILNNGLSGVYNLGSQTTLSKYEFACKLAELFGLDTKLIQSIDVESFPFAAKRGKNLTLNVDKLAKAHRIELPSIELSLDRFFWDYRQGLPQRIKQRQMGNKFYPQLPYISYGRQSIDNADIEAVVDALKSSHLTQGERINDFEKALCDHTGVRFAVAFNSGTSALHCACLAAGVQAGDQVITSPNTFVASINCALYCGAKPVFADIDSETYNLNPQTMAAHISSRTKAVIPVHFAGQSCDMEAIQSLVRQKETEFGQKIFIIEDGSHALGSCYQRKPVGLCVYSDMTVMSFHPVKHITTGEGGAVLTNNADLAAKLRRFRSHGITNNPEEFQSAAEAFDASGRVNPWYYEQQCLGYNYRITDLQCALGISQMRKLPQFMRRRREIVKLYNQAFAGCRSVRLPFEDPAGEANWHLYVLCIDFPALGIERGDCMRTLSEDGIKTQVHYIPIHLQPYFRNNFGYKRGDYPVAEAYYAQALSLPLYPSLEERDISKVISAVLKTLKL